MHWHWLIFMHAWVWFLTHCWHLQLHVCFLTDGLTLFLSGGHAFPFTRSSRTKHTPGKLYSYLKCMYIFYPFAVVHFWLHSKGFIFLFYCSFFLCNLWFFVLCFCFLTDFSTLYPYLKCMYIFSCTIKVWLFCNLGKHSVFIFSGCRSDGICVDWVCLLPVTCFFASQGWCDDFFMFCLMHLLGFSFLIYNFPKFYLMDFLMFFPKFCFVLLRSFEFI